MYNENLLYVLTILESIEKILIYNSDFNDPDEFFLYKDQVNFNASVNLLIAVGEESKKISQPLKDKFNKISWKSLAGLRDKISHDYRGIDPSIIWSIIREKLPELKIVCIEIFKTLEVDKETIEEILKTEFYKHLTYLKEL